MCKKLEREGDKVVNFRKSFLISSALISSTLSKYLTIQ